MVPYHLQDEIRTPPHPISPLPAGPVPWWTECAPPTMLSAWPTIPPPSPTHLTSSFPQTLALFLLLHKQGPGPVPGGDKWGPKGAHLKKMPTRHLHDPESEASLNLPCVPHFSHPSPRPAPMSLLWSAHSPPWILSLGCVTGPNWIPYRSVHLSGQRWHASVLILGTAGLRVFRPPTLELAPPNPALCPRTPIHLWESI